MWVPDVSSRTMIVESSPYSKSRGTACQYFAASTRVLFCDILIVFLRVLRDAVKTLVADCDIPTICHTILAPGSQSKERNPLGAVV